MTRYFDTSSSDEETPRQRSHCAAGRDDDACRGVPADQGQPRRCQNDQPADARRGGDRRARPGGCASAWHRLPGRAAGRAHFRRRAPTAARLESVVFKIVYKSLFLRARDLSCSRTTPTVGQIASGRAEIFDQGSELQVPIKESAALARRACPVARLRQSKFGWGTARGEADGDSSETPRPAGRTSPA